MKYKAPLGEAEMLNGDMSLSAQQIIKVIYLNQQESLSRLS